MKETSKNTRNRLAAVLLAAVCMLSVLAACGSNEASKFYGTWQSTIDMSDIISEGWDDDIKEYVEISDFNLTILFTFNEDGTYSITVDESLLQESFDQLKDQFAVGMEAYLTDYIDEMGLGMSLDEFWELADTSLEELVEESFGDEIMDSLVSELVAEGNWKVSGGKLYMSDGVNASIDESMYETYEISGNQLTLLEGVGGDDGEETIAYPFVMTKVE